MPSSVGRTLAIDDSCWYRWILILGRMGSRLLSRVIIILQFRTEFHHLPQTQLIWVVRSQKYESSSQRLSSKSLYPNVEPQPPPAQTRMAPRTPSKAPSSADMPGPAQLAVYRLKAVKPTEAEVRRALHELGYSRSRISQLLAECAQHPPRNWLQRQRQTAQDQPQCIHDDRKN